MRGHAWRAERRAEPAKGYKSPPGAGVSTAIDTRVGDDTVGLGKDSSRTTTRTIVFRCVRVFVLVTILHLIAYMANR